MVSELEHSVSGQRMIHRTHYAFHILVYSRCHEDCHQRTLNTHLKRIHRVSIQIYIQELLLIAKCLQELKGKSTKR